MCRKYELVGTGQSRHIDGEFRPLYQIRALHDFGDVKAGDLGGYVDGEGALSHEGLCWIADTSCVEVGDSVKKAPLVRRDAQVLAGCVIRGSVVAGGSRIHQSTVYNSVVRGESCVENSWLCVGAAIGGRSVVIESRLTGTVVLDAVVERVHNVGGVFDRGSVVRNYKNLPNRLVVRGYITIDSDRSVFAVGPLGSRDARCVFFENRVDGEIWVNTGCFWGVLSQFREAVHRRHSWNVKYIEEYERAMDIAVKQLS